MLAKQLKRLRLEANLKQDVLLKKFSLSSARYSQYESGKRRPDYELLLQLADFYNVSVDYLLGRTVTSKNNTTLTASEVELIKKYRALDEDGKGRIDNALEYEYKLKKGKLDKSLNITSAS